MTNAELLAKIKAEIDRLYGEYKDKFHQCGDQYHLGLIDGLDMAERVLDTLESEKPMQEGLEDILLEFYDEYDSNVENRPLIPRIYAEKLARHFAQWGAEHLATSGKTLEIKPGDEVAINGHKIVYDKDKGYVTIVKSEESVPNDREEAADNHIRKVVDAAGHPGWDWATQDIVDAFIAGAKWQAEQLLKSSPLPEDTVLFNKGVEEGKRLMMEEAVETRVIGIGLGDTPHIVLGFSDEFKKGDKVRVIVLPKED